jgi:3-oxoadipate enol-lactonase
MTRFDPSLRQELHPPAIGRLAEIRAPTLITEGEHGYPDIHVIADFLAAGIAGATKVVMAGAGHIVNREQPEAFSNVVLDFLHQL